MKKGISTDRYNDKISMEKRLGTRLIAHLAKDFIKSVQIPDLPNMKCIHGGKGAEPRQLNSCEQCCRKLGSTALIL